MPLYTAEPASTIAALQVLTEHAEEYDALATYEAMRGQEGWIGGRVRPPQVEGGRWRCQVFYLNVSGLPPGEAGDGARYVVIPLSQAAALGVDLQEAHGAVLSSCWHADRSAELTDGRRVCCECWNLSVYIRRAAMKAERDKRMRCEVCKTAAATYDLGTPRQISVCGRCKRRIDQAHRQRLGSVPSYLAMFATVHYTREQFIKLAQADHGERVVFDASAGETLEQAEMF